MSQTDRQTKGRIAEGRRWFLHNNFLILFGNDLSEDSFVYWRKYTPVEPRFGSLNLYYPISTDFKAYDRSLGTFSKARNYYKFWALWKECREKRKSIFILLTVAIFHLLIFASSLLIFDDHT